MESRQAIPASRRRPPLGAGWRRGSVLMYAAFLALPALVGVGGIVVDVGRIQLVKLELQQVADAASRHGAGGVMQGASTALARARSAATSPDVKVDGRRLTDAEVTCEYGNWNPRLREFVPKGTSSVLAGNAIRVSARRSVPLSFMTLFGKPDAMMRVASTSYLPGALFVVGNAASPEMDDVVAANRLWNAKQAVDLVSASSVSSADAAGHSVIVISETVAATAVGTKLRDVAVPIVCYEPFLFDDFQMTGTAGTEFGWTYSATELRLAARQGYLFGVPDGTPVTLQSSAGASGQGFGKPSSSATVVMTQVGDPSRASVFYYEKGAAMVGRSAPHRRVGLWIFEFNRLNSTGAAVFDGAVRLAVGDARAVVTVE